MEGLKKNHCLKGRGGFIAIESIFVMSFLLIVLFLLLGFFTFIQPYNTLNREVHTLAQLAERQGGLTIEDVDSFKARIADYQFVDLNKGDITITAQTMPSGMEAVGVDGIDTAGKNYVKRDSKEYIEMIVSVPSYNTVLTPVANYFGVQGANDHYTFKEVFMSERY